MRVESAHEPLMDTVYFKYNEGNVHWQGYARSVGGKNRGGTKDRTARTSKG